jgi:GT2 family glycosyltransferase
LLKVEKDECTCAKDLGGDTGSQLQGNYRKVLGFVGFGGVSSFEALIMDDGSTDGTADVCESRQWVKLTRLDRRGPSCARNKGIELASGEFVAFTDGDCVVGQAWLKELCKAFVSDDVAGVGGDQTSPADETRFGRTVQEFFKQIGFMTGYIKNDSALVEVEHNPSCNSMYRKSVLEDLGGFDEALFPGEDVDLDYRIRSLGYKLIFNPFAVVGHYRPGTCRAFVSMMRRYGSSQWRLAKKHGFFRRILFVPPLFVVTLCCLAALLWHEPARWPAILAPLPLLWLWFGLRARSAGRGLLFTFLLVVTLVSWNWGFFTEMVSLKSGLDGRSGVS